MTLKSNDGEVHSFRASAPVPWLSISPASGNLTGTVTLQLTANPAGLRKGTYSTRVRIESNEGTEWIELPVIMAVSGTGQQLDLSQSGLTFVATEGVVSLPAKTLRVLNTGSGRLSWSAITSTLSGGSQWLTASPGSGNTDSGQTAPEVSVQVRPQGLAPGVYYGLVSIAAPAADNAPQSVVVLLVVEPRGTTPGPIVEPLGAIVTASLNGSPAAERLTLVNVGASAENWTATLRFPDNRTWFTLSAVSGALAAGQSAFVDVKPALNGIPAGTYRGAVDFRFTPANQTITVTLLLVVAPGAASAAKLAPVAAEGTCTPVRILPVFRAPGASFTTTAGWPAPIEVQAVDDCGVPVTKGAGTVTFSSNDPPIILTHTGNGLWTGTWAARTVRTSGYRIDAKLKNGSVEGVASVTGSVREGEPAPTVNPGGLVNAASFGKNEPVAPGAYVSIFGHSLSRELKIADSAPLPPQLGDTLAVIGGLSLPLHFTSDGQMNALIPYDVTDSTRLELLVRRGLAYSIPEKVLVAANQPAVFTVDGTGSGQGHIYGTSPDGYPQLVDVAHPAAPGDVVVVYASGLGAVDNPVRAGTITPGDRLVRVLGDVKATIQGKPVQVLFAGLTPGQIGLYQLNVQVGDVEPDSAAQMVITVNGQSSKAVLLSVTR